MANTYYDSQLTAAEIEAVLEAIAGILTPANNGKVLAINNGKLEARSVQWGGGAPVIEALSVTANGTYTAPTGIDGYSPVTVNVSGGGGEKYYLYNSGQQYVSFDNPVTQSGNQTVSFGSDSIDFSYTNPSNTGFYIKTTNKIDCTNYNLLFIELSSGTVGTGQYFPAFGVASSVTSYLNIPWLESEAIPANISNGKLGVYLNNVGEAYIAIGGFTLNASVKAIYLQTV